GTRGEGGDEQLAVAVLEEVEVDLPAPGTEGASGRRDLAQVRLQDTGEQLAEQPALLERALPAERNEHVQAGRAGGLQVAGQLDLAAQAPGGQRHLHHVSERRSLGIEVEDAPV